MDTIIYIDGYNLFYGRLKNTSFKWLDIHELFQSIIQIQNPASKIVKIKYFTAPVKANFSSHGQESPQSQNTYHRALKYIYGDGIDIIQGYHTIEKAIPLRYKDPIDKKDRVEIWKFEEKQSDVNLALHMYKDSLSNNIIQQVLVTSDSDLAPALELINQDSPQITLGLILPRSNRTTTAHSRPPNQSLTIHSNWTRKYIRDDECQKAQLPEKIPTRKKPIIKPHYW